MGDGAQRLVQTAPAVPGTGLAEPVLDAQRVFRTLLTAMAEPGQPRPLDAGLGVEPPPPLGRPAAAALLTLADVDTPVWLDPQCGPSVTAYLRFHAGIPIVDDPGQASFALVLEGSALPPLDRFAQGTPEYPDRSTTLIVQGAALREGRRFHLAGPGIDGSLTVALAGIAADLWEAMTRQRALFPLGVDGLVMVDGQVIGLPRSLALAA